MPGLPIVFFILAAVAVGTALGMLISRNTVYSALFLVMNFTTVAVLYLILGAPFIALAQITVYAGSIMVLFLFVIMLLGAERLQATVEGLRWQAYLAIPLALVLAVEFALNLFQWTGAVLDVTDTPANYGAPELVGQMLFTQFMLPVEVVALILLSATVGAIILAKPDKPSVGRVVRGINPAVAAPAAGAPSSTERQVPAEEQEQAIKQG